MAISGAGAVTYTPAANYNGPDAFSATVSDGRGGSASSTFNVTVTAVNDPPVITGATLTFVEDTESSQALTMSDAEGDDILLDVLTLPTHGTLGAIVGNNVTYQPGLNFNGQDSFTVRASDEHGLAGPVVTVTLNVTAVNDAPVAVDDQRVVPAGVATSVNVRANDSDIEGDTLTVSIVTPPAQGVATVVNNEISYTPPAGFSGPQSLVYRATDPAGASSTANLHMTVGTFQNVFYIGGVPTGNASQTQIYYFDGFQGISLNPLSSYQTFDFAFSGDGRWIVYRERSSQSDRGSMYLQSLATADPRSLLPMNGSNLNYALNRDGSYLAYWNLSLPFDPFQLDASLYRVSDRSSAFFINPMQPTVIPNLAPIFNPVSDEFYFRARVTATYDPTRVGPAFNSLFAGSIAAPPASRIGANYTPDTSGSGSGNNLRITADGNNLVHVGVENGMAGTVASLLVNNRVTNTETDLYRPFAVGEFPAPNEFDMNGSGSSVCFRVNDPGAASTGPGRVWVASPAAPGAATAVTPQADYHFDCRFASDGRTIAWLTANGGAQPEVYLVDSTVPNVIRRMREPLVAGESTEFFVVARTRMRAVVGINPAGGGGPVFYRVDLDSPGTSVRIASPGVVGTNARYTLSDDGSWLAYLKDIPNPGGAGTIKQLNVTSTDTPDLNLVIGDRVEAFQFRPVP